MRNWMMSELLQLNVWYFYADVINISVIGIYVNLENIILQNPKAQSTSKHFWYLFS